MRISSCFFSADANVGDRFREIRVWTTGGDIVYTLSGHTSFVYSITVLPGGEIASGGEDRTLRVWRGNITIYSSSVLLITNTMFLDEECVQTIVHLLPPLPPLLPISASLPSHPTPIHFLVQPTIHPPAVRIDSATRKVYYALQTFCLLAWPLLRCTSIQVCHSVTDLIIGYCVR